jgi:hypothetical protein
MDGTGDLLALRALSVSLEMSDDFTELYEKALKKAKKQGNIDQIRQLKKVLMGQCLYMLGQYLREEARIRECEERGEIQ